MPKLSVVLAVKDEAQMLEGCLQSVAFADEIIVVVDDRTTDDTAKIAQRYTDRVLFRTFDGFASQKNFAIEQATGDWILLLDADERCSNALAHALPSVMQQQGFVAYRIPFRQFLLGTEMRHGGWDEQHIRLWQRGQAKYTAKEIHEVLAISGPVGTLTAPIEHHSHRSIDHIMGKLHQYTTLDAEHLFGANFPDVSLWHLIFIPLKFFVYYYVWLQGFRDGKAGLIEVALNRSLYQFLVYAKLWAKQQGF